MTYQSTSLGSNAYEIQTEFDGEPITFTVIAASDESEVPNLVEHHLNYLANPNPVYPESTEPTPTLEQTVQEQAALIKELSDRLAAAGL